MKKNEKEIDPLEKSINSALKKISWKLLKKELDRLNIEANLERILNFVIHSECLVNKRGDVELREKIKILIHELLLYISKKTSYESYVRFEKKVKFLSTIESCFSGILNLQSEYPDLKLLSSRQKIWSCLKYFVENFNALEEKMADRFQSGGPIFINNLFIEDMGGNSFDPSTYHVQQVSALGSALFMEAYKNNWFEKDGSLVLPSYEDVSDDAVHSAGVIFYCANTWGLFDYLQEQVRYLGRDFSIIESFKYIDAPPNFDFSIRFGENPYSEIFDYIASRRNHTREFSNAMSIRELIRSDSHLKSIQSNPIYDYLSDFYVSSSSLSVLLNYDIAKDTNLYACLTLNEWISGFCAVRDFFRKKRSLTMQEKSRKFSSELIHFNQDSLVDHLIMLGFSLEKGLVLVDNLTFNKRSRDLFDSPLIKKENGYLAVYDIVLGSVVSRAVASNILSRKLQFDTKGAELENSLREIFIENNIETRSYKKVYPAPEGEYEYDALVLWGDVLFVFECKNRWLCESRPIAIYNHEKQINKDINQVNRLVHGLQKNPSMLTAAFGREIAYKKIVPCVVSGLPYSMTESQSGIYFTDISIITRFFSSRYFEIESVDKSSTQPLRIYDQWSSFSPSAEDLIKSISKPLQVLVETELLEFKKRFCFVGSSIVLEYDYITTKQVEVEEYISILDKT